MTEHYHDPFCEHTITRLPDKVTYGFNHVPADMPEVVGLFVGGCVQRGVGSSFRRVAHAHNHKGDETYGWICFRSPKRVLTPSGKPSVTVYHEYAHILCPNRGHDRLWRETITRLGFPGEAKRVQKIYCKHREARMQWEGNREVLACPCGHIKRFTKSGIHIATISL